MIKKKTQKLCVGFPHTKLPLIFSAHMPSGSVFDVILHLANL